MIRLRRCPFAELVNRQLDLFQREHAGLIAECKEALRAYERAATDEAEPRYGEYVDITDSVRDTLEEIRDTYARTLDPVTADTYRGAFNELARKRFPPFASELD
jgi:hypothetical protein